MNEADGCTPGDACSDGYMCFKHKARTLVFGGERTKNVKEWRDPVDGHRVKRTRDDATSRGNLVTEHATKDDRVDVLVRPDELVYSLGRKS